MEDCFSFEILVLTVTAFLPLSTIIPIPFFLNTEDDHWRKQTNNKKTDDFSKRSSDKVIQ